jgi:hypothetical protein
MSQTFTSHNDLEEKLVAAQEGRLDSDVFMQQLLDQQLFMPVQDEASEIQGFQRSTRAKPLSVEAEDGSRVLVLFTSPERAKPFLQDFPDYGGGLLSEFSWILERIGSGVAIAINPGIEFGIDLESDMVTQHTSTLPGKSSLRRVPEHIERVPVREPERQRSYKNGVPPASAQTGGCIPSRKTRSPGYRVSARPPTSWTRGNWCGRENRIEN